jgi:hypothetical protein
MGGSRYCPTPRPKCCAVGCVSGSRGYGAVWLARSATGVLVETLLDHAADGDVAEAEAAIERLAAAPAEEGLVIREIWPLRVRTLLARAHGDDVDYRDLVSRYRDMAKTLGCEGHIAWAEAMVADEE